MLQQEAADAQLDMSPRQLVAGKLLRPAACTRLEQLRSRPRGCHFTISFDTLYSDRVLL